MKDSLVLLHGWISSKEQFRSSSFKYRKLIGSLRQLGYDVLAPDLPGFGSSEIPRIPQTLSDYASFLHKHLTDKAVTKPVLFGHSFGGRVALVYQYMYPQSVRAIILSGTPGFSPVNKIKLTVAIVLAKLGGSMCSIPPFSFIKDRLRDWFYWVVGARDYYRAERTMRETFKNIVQEDLRKAMQAVTVPCLLLWGQKDTTVPTSVAEKMKDMIPYAKLCLVPDASHSLPETHASACSVQVQKFLSSL